MPPRPGSTWTAARRAACTPEYRAKLSAAKKGTPAWNKGLKMDFAPRKRRGPGANDRPDEGK